MTFSNKLLILFWAAASVVHAQPTISFTFDDGITDDLAGYPFAVWNEMLLDHLDKGGIKAIFFVTGSNKMNEKGQQLLSGWSARGHKIGNHTFSHLNYNSEGVTYPRFVTQFVRTDSIIRRYDNYIPMFRFPYLKEGNTKEKVEKFRLFLKQQHYRNGHVTIDGSDWYIASRLRRRLSQDPDAKTDGFRSFYLAHLYDRALYYEELAFKLTGRHINHTLLLHHNLTSALFLGDLIELFKSKGWKIIDAEEAYKDPIFQEEPSNIPAGESLIWALAKASGKYETVLRYPAEDSEYEKDKMDKLGL